MENIFHKLGSNDLFLADIILCIILIYLIYFSMGYFNIHGTKCPLLRAYFSLSFVLLSPWVPDEVIIDIGF